MKRIAIIIGVILIFIAPIAFMYFYQQQYIDDLEAKNDALTGEIEALKAARSNTGGNNQTEQGAYTSKKGVGLVVSTPASGTEVKSPLEVKGSVPGNWSFEAQFVVRLLDDNGSTLAEEPATLSGDWMTEDMVPFSVVLIFTAPDSDTGSLVLEKANPSGEAENDDSLTIPVRF